MSRRPLLQAGSLALLLLGTACGDDGATSDGAAGGGGSAGAGEPWLLDASEACRLSVPSLGLELDGTGRAKRNGSGNVIVECYGFQDEAVTLEIHIGNGDYDGPGDYPMINDGSRGSLSLRLDEDTVYESYSDDVTSGCELTVTVAEPDWEPAVGTRFAGTFSCTNLENVDADAGSEPIDIEGGEFDLGVL